MDDLWQRVRFHADEDDPRPVVFPPPGPYWISGRGEGYSIIVAFVKRVEQVKEHWPEAANIDVMQENVPLTFNERFSKPEWWHG